MFSAISQLLKPIAALSGVSRLQVKFMPAARTVEVSYVQGGQVHTNQFPFADIEAAINGRPPKESPKSTQGQPDG